MKTLVDWGSPIFLFRRTDRSTHNDLDGEGHENLKMWDKKVDFSEKLEEIPAEEFPVDEFKSKADFEAWLEEKFEGYEDGFYYLFTRCLTYYPLRRRKEGKQGRPKYSYSSHGECAGRRQHFYGRPFRRVSGKWTCIAKFEIGSSQIISVPEKRTMRKHAPYNKPKFPIIKAIERGKRGQLES